MYFLFNKTGVKDLYYTFSKYWLSRLRPVVESIFDEVFRKMLIPVKIFSDILKAYMMVYIITKFHESSFSQLEVQIGGIFSSSFFHKWRSKIPLKIGLNYFICTRPWYAKTTVISLTLRCLLNGWGRLLIFRFFSDSPRSLLGSPVYWFSRNAEVQKFFL